MKTIIDASLRMAAPVALSVLASTASASVMEASSPEPAPNTQATTPSRWVRVEERSTRLHNLPSTSGAPLMDVAPGMLLAVHGERAGFLEVAVPGGIEVWIYGEYTRESGAPGILEITGDRLNMRPLPSASENSFPLRQRLHRGDRVRMISRLDPMKPLVEDWVRIWSPPEARAWVRASSTTPLAAGDDGAAAWTAAVDAALVAQAKSPATARSDASSAQARGTQNASAKATPKTAQTATAASPGLQAAVREAELQYDAVRSGSGDVAVAIGAWLAVAEMAPQSDEARIAGSRIEELQARDELARLQNDVESWKQTRDQERERAEADLASVQARKDPLMGRYQARGWLESEARPDGTTGWLIRWAGQPTAEIVCTSGRYDLAVFADYELGVVGATTRAPIPASIGRTARPMRIDASRLEVLSGRYKGR